MKYPIRNAPGYLKDSETGVVINTNISEYELIKEKRKAAKRREEMDDLKSELEALKQLVREKLK